MDLHSYLSKPDAPSVPQLRQRMAELGYPVKSDAQIRQWRYGYGDRVPSPENCMGLELATDGQVSRRDTRPNDYGRIWPELVEAADA